MPPHDTDRKFNTWNQLPMSNTALGVAGAQAQRSMQGMA